MKITIQEGDYANRRKMGEAKYLECAQKFLEAGCPLWEDVGEYPSFRLFGWADQSVEGLFHSDFRSTFSGRELTYEQIMGTTTPVVDDLTKTHQVAITALRNKNEATIAKLRDAMFESELDIIMFNQEIDRLEKQICVLRNSGSKNEK